MDTNDFNLARRRFLQISAAAAGSVSASAQAGDQWTTVDDFDRPDSLYHGDGWETLNPGYWRIRNHALGRKLHNIGDQNPTDKFPFHWESNYHKPIPTDVDPSLPEGMIWRRDWRLKGNYKLRAEITVEALPPRLTAPRHKQDQPGYGVLGVCFGGRTLWESRQGGAKPGNGAWMAAWRDDGVFALFDHAKKGDLDAGNKPRAQVGVAAGDRIAIEVEVSGGDAEVAVVKATLSKGALSSSITADGVNRRMYTDGYFGLVARGLLQFAVNRVAIQPGANQPVAIDLNDCHICYALGHTLRQENDKWTCRFVALFRNDGSRAEIRIAGSPNPAGGWGKVPLAGWAHIVTNDFRRNTAIITATLPASPAGKTLYYTIWKDGRNVTADPRVDNADMRLPGTGLTDPAPATGHYTGRLPQLKAPYHVCGLGGHALHRGNPNLPNADNFQENWVHDQPTPHPYRHMDDYSFQIVDWDDDVWYLELLFCPPSTDDAYRTITNSIAGPTTRWQFMRHWNLVNPGDHDLGMDDIKGPEQYIIRKFKGLGQDRDYMRRNYQVVLHLTQADEKPSGTSNPRIWHHWRMPDGDFSLLVMDARRWRTSQDTDIWKDWGWKPGLLRRQDPTRTLLGEEQFAWLREVVRNDPSPLILLTGINCMHTIFTGREIDPETGFRFAQRDRVSADYAGWVTEGCNRVIELLGSRQGIVSVYGDIHLGSLVEDNRNRSIECSFGPIGRSGSRGLIKGFGRHMKDVDGREVTVHALYHQRYDSPEQDPNNGPPHWNFLQIDLDPRPTDPRIRLRIRNIIDPPTEQPRGGGSIDRPASATGRPPSSRLPAVTMLPNAEVRITTAAGQPVRGTRTLADGSFISPELIGVPAGARLIATAVAGNRTESKLLRAESLS